MGKQPEDEIRDWMGLTGCEDGKWMELVERPVRYCDLVLAVLVTPQTEGHAETAKDCAGWKYRDMKKESWSISKE
jgi:hypothetical protein